MTPLVLLAEIALFVGAAGWLFRRRRNTAPERRTLRGWQLGGGYFLLLGAVRAALILGGAPVPSGNLVVLLASVTGVLSARIATRRLPTARTTPAPR